MPPVMMGSVMVFSFALMEARFSRIDEYGVERGERVDVLYDYLEREVILVVVVVVYYQFHLSSISSIYYQ